MFEQKVKRGTTLLFQLAFKYFSIKLGLTVKEINMININTVRRLHGAQGSCSGHYIHGQLVKVNIKILNASDLGLIDVMAHEMVHARQNLRGEFSFQTKLKYKWGFWPYAEVKRYHKNQCLNDTPYYEQLCEQEAYMLSREMVRQFLNFMHHLENNVEFVAEQEKARCVPENVRNNSETKDDSVHDGRTMGDDCVGVCVQVLKG